MSDRGRTYLDTGDRVVVRDGDPPNEVRIIVNEQSLGVSWKVARRIFEGLEVALRERYERGLHD